jgi:hypothetical protein
MNYSFRKRVAALVCTATLGLGAFSCQDSLLNVKPVALLDAGVAFDSPSRVLAQVNGLYSYVKVGGFLGGRYQIYGDIRANDFINRTSNSVTGLAVWNHTLAETSQNDVVSVWGNAYAAINQVNIFLAGLDANAEKFKTSSFTSVFPNGFDATATNYRAEARLLRALCYYSLLQLYARPYIDGNGSRPGLPLRLAAETGLGNNDLARSTVAQVYDQILLDLNYAEQNLPLRYAAAQGNISVTTLNVTRAHRNTAIALKTRVYLSMGNYAAVITEANKLVPTASPFVAPSGVSNALNPSVTTVFTAPQETTESILAFPFTAQDAPGTQNQLAYYYLPTSLGGNGEYGLNTGAGSIYANAGFTNPTDARRNNFVFPVSTTTAGVTRTEYFLTKYPTGTPFTDKAPVIRYPEVMLSLAEARVRTTNSVDAQALTLLNAVRVRSIPGRPEVPATATTPAIPAIPDGSYAAASLTPATMLDAILLERRIEFLGEGIRNIDLMRLNATIPAKGTVSAIPSTAANYVWPIPSTELSTNNLMSRN